ncbi:MAG: hypothetical protein LH629_12005, partial [Ignavibacteria bacterium]|nr:hypothetical protein [Ignavibacteria bacterium]
MITTISTNSILSSLRRQAVHWRQAASRLSVLDNLVSSTAWHGIERNLGVTLREHLQKSIDEVLANANNLFKMLSTTKDPSGLRSLKRSIVELRDQYLKAEETLHFYTVAVNSRTSANVAALLRACDILCLKSMEELLQPLGKTSPPVLTYIDKGIGASILKAGLRLWDKSVSPLAAIKVTQHN